MLYPKKAGNLAWHTVTENSVGTLTGRVGHDSVALAICQSTVAHGHGMDFLYFRPSGERSKIRHCDNLTRHFTLVLSTYLRQAEEQAHAAC